MSTFYVANIPFSSDDISHHGIKGQKWGVRRSPQELGYDVGQRIQGRINDFGNRLGSKIQNGINSAVKPAQAAYEKGQQVKQKLSSEKVKSRMKTAAKVGAALAVTGLAAYGGYKLNKLINEGNKGYLTDLRINDVLNVDKAYGSMKRDLFKSKFRRPSNDELRRRYDELNGAHARAINDIKNDIAKAAKNTKFRDKISNARKYRQSRGHVDIDSTARYYIENYKRKK